MPNKKTDKVYKNFNPKSLENLKPIPKVGEPGSTEIAQERQALGVKKRMERKELLTEFKDIADQVKTEVSGVQVMRVLMMKAMQGGDYEQASIIANQLAPYESAKLSSVTTHDINIDTSKMTNKELEDYAKSLGLDINNEKE